jgi:WD40 repeat protein
MPHAWIKRIVHPSWPAMLLLAALALSGRALVAQQREGEPKAEPPPVKAGEIPRGQAVDRYGDPLPAGALARLGSIRFRHPAMITMLAVAPSGKHVVTYCQGNPMLRRCDLTTGEVVEFHDLGAAFRAVSTSRRTSLVFTASDDRLIAVSPNSVQAIDPEKKTASVLKSDLQQGFVLCTSISRDGKLLALVQTRGSGRVLVISTADGKTVQDIPKAVNSPIDVAFTHDGTAITISSHNQSEGLRSWSVETGKELSPIKELQGNAVSLAYSSDGRWLAAGHGQPSLSIIDLKAGEKVQKTKTLGGFTSSLRWVDFTPDGKTLLAYDNMGMLAVFDPEQGKELRKFHVGPSQALPAISPDGKRVITSEGNVVDAWSIETGEPVHPYDGHRSYLMQAAISPDGKWAATMGQDNTLRVWDVATSRQVLHRRRPGYGSPSVAFTGDGRHLLWANSPTSIEFLEVSAIAGDKPAAVAREIRGNQFAMFAISEDGRTLVANNSAGGGGGSQIWNLTQEKPNAVFVAATFGANGMPLAYSADARVSATKFNVDGTGQQLVIADLARRREITRLISPGQQPLQGVFAGSRLFASRSQRQIALWDVLSGKSVVSVNAAGAATTTTALTCSGDGRLLVWAENDAERSIRLYDSLNGRELGKFGGHMGFVHALALYTSGERPVLVSGSYDSTALVWDLRSILDEVRKNTPRLASEPADRLWADLGSDDAAAMHRASWVLAAAGEEAVPVLAERLEPVPIDQALGEKIARLVAQMDDDLFSVREQASRQAAELGEPAEPHLLEALKTTDSAEARHRVRRLLAEIAARPLVLTTDQQRAIRAVQILEQIGGGEARAIFERLSQGQPSARLTQEAKNALARLDESEMN